METHSDVNRVRLGIQPIINPIADHLRIVEFYNDVTNGSPNPFLQPAPTNEQINIYLFFTEHLGRQYYTGIAFASRYIRRGEHLYIAPPREDDD